MSKQTIEIEIPDGKKAVWKNGKVVFIPVEHWENIKTFEAAYKYVGNNLPECQNLIIAYNASEMDSYEEKIAMYRIIVAALTNNEKRHLTTGEAWFPAVQFCRPKNKTNCWGNVVVGTIESEGERYLVVGGSAYNGTNAGLGDLDSKGVVSLSYAAVSFRSVSSKEIAGHISKYFGKLLFEIHYGGINCDWKWVD